MGLVFSQSSVLAYVLFCCALQQAKAEPGPPPGASGQPVQSRQVNQPNQIDFLTPKHGKHIAFPKQRTQSVLEIMSKEEYLSALIHTENEIKQSVETFLLSHRKEKIKSYRRFSTQGFLLKNQKDSGLDRIKSLFTRRHFDNTLPFIKIGGAPFDGFLIDVLIIEMVRRKYSGRFG